MTVNYGILISFPQNLNIRLGSPEGRGGRWHLHGLGLLVLRRFPPVSSQRAVEGKGPQGSLHSCVCTEAPPGPAHFVLARSQAQPTPGPSPGGAPRPCPPDLYWLRGFCNLAKFLSACMPPWQFYPVYQVCHTTNSFLNVFTEEKLQMGLRVKWRSLHFEIPDSCVLVSGGRAGQGKRKACATASFWGQLWSNCYFPKPVWEETQGLQCSQYSHFVCNLWNSQFFTCFDILCFSSQFFSKWFVVSNLEFETSLSPH